MLKTNRREFLATGTAGAALNAVPGIAFRAAPPNRRSLAESFPPGKLRALLVPPASWKPFPTAGDRAAWASLAAGARTALTADGERRVGFEWPALPATLFLEFARAGNRSHYEHARDLRREALRELVIAECLEGRGRFLENIANGIWATCEETFWGVPAHLGMQKAGTGLPDVTEPIVDLFAAETGSLLAWTHYLLEPRLAKINRLLPERVRYEIRRRILVPCMERDDFWWMGLIDSHDVNNWNPWICSNWLTCVLAIETDADRRAAAVHKVCRCLDRFLAAYHDDGGCDEGPSYWGRAGASLFDCLELLHSASRGAIDFYSEPLVREIGRYIYRAHIAGDWYVNFADAPARVEIDADLVFRYGKRIGDEKMQALGAFTARGQGLDAVRAESVGRELPALFNMEALRGASGGEPLVRDAWLPGVQVMAARARENSAQGLYLAAQGGHNAESHNHNDVGNFIVYADGRPVLIDVGVETYTAKTFSSERYDIWTMQSAYHNLPTIDDVMQSDGREFAARNVDYKADDEAAVFSLDIARAYPSRAGIERWQRTFRFERPANRIELRDDYALSRRARRIAWTLMTPCTVTEAGPSELSFGGLAKVRFEGVALKANPEEIRIEDPTLKSVWGERLNRVLLVAVDPPSRATVKLTITYGS